ncbi:MAG: DNA repair protein RecN [Dehalococcoidia bacterium]|nr:DNA repair protein RecN [Dehalococcoidia bacterium]MCB9484773.1 DNA repair protein RecN [Thermoflexaceae bacterium]
MLKELTIEDFAVAREVRLEPGAGLNVFTGETGAGKSLVVDALAFVLGAKKGREIIAGGAERARVRARLHLGGTEVEIERTITAAGRSTAKIDGRAATLDEVQSLAAGNVDIHGQAEQSAILRPAVQLAALDLYAGLDGQRVHAGELVRALRDVRRKARSLREDADQRERLADQLRFESDEIAGAGIAAVDEDAALQQERSRLGSVTRLIEAAVAVEAALAEPAIGAAIAAAEDIERYDGGAAEIAAAAALLETAALDLARSVRVYRETLEADPERLATIDERLDRLARLKRKYGGTLEAVIAHGRQAAERLTGLDSADERCAELEARASTLLLDLSAVCTALSIARRAAAGALVRALTAELEHLGMGQARLAAGFQCEDDPDGVEAAFPDYERVAGDPVTGAAGENVRRSFSETGIDRVEFLASFNAGDEPRPLASVASGGETSRFLLALTIVLGKAAGQAIVVFDEVDEGVGGRTGSLVGEALARLGQERQVLCVTHLPQVAAYGDRHFVVSKVEDGGRPASRIVEVSGGTRVDELAAMLGGVTHATRAAAKELLAERGGVSSRT